jgi:hypothetical protein
MGSGSVGRVLLAVSDWWLEIVLVLVVVLVLEKVGAAWVASGAAFFSRRIEAIFLIPYCWEEQPFSSTRTRTSTIFGLLRSSKPADIGLSCPCLNLLLLLIGPVVPISSIKKLNQQELT